MHGEGDGKEDEEDDLKGDGEGNGEGDEKGNVEEDGEGDEKGDGEGNGEGDRQSESDGIPHCHCTLAHSWDTRHPDPKAPPTEANTN